MVVVVVSCWSPCEFAKDLWNLVWTLLFDLGKIGLQRRIWLEVVMAGQVLRCSMKRGSGGSKLLVTV